jgi:hypothetical protein
MKIYKYPIELPQDILILKLETDKDNDIPHLTDIIGGCYLLDFPSNNKNQTTKIVIHTKDQDVINWLLSQKEIHILTTHQSINKGFFNTNKKNEFDTRRITFKSTQSTEEFPEGFDKLGLEWMSFNYISKKIIKLEEDVSHNTSERLRLEFCREKLLKKILED